MSSNRPRTGLKKPREMERELRGEAWFHSRKRAFTPEEEAEFQAVMSRVSAFSGWNDVAKTLGLMAEVFECESFAVALADMKRLDLLGKDLPKKIAEKQGVWADPIEGAIVSMVEELKQSHPDWSGEQIFEQTAFTLRIAATSFAGAVQKVKRTLLPKR